MSTLGTVHRQLKALHTGLVPKRLPHFHHGEFWPDVACESGVARAQRRCMTDREQKNCSPRHSGWWSWACPPELASTKLVSF